MQRRGFLNTSALTGAGMLILPGGVLAGKNSPNNKLNIALIGVCVQNDVILVAKIRDYLNAGYDLRAAVMAGSLRKFRAILMTNLVMIVGSIPLAFHVSTGSELHRPLAMVYIGGFLGAIVLRMIAMPVFFAWVMGMRRPLQG